MTDPTRDLLINLASHMAYMQGQLEAHHQLDDLEDYYWFRESVTLRQKVADALAGDPAAPAPPADGEVAELVELAAWLRRIGPCNDQEAANFNRAAELLQQQALVPVAVSDALIKAECALADIAEGEPMTDEGDLLQWAERRCADTLAIIRPTMSQHKIRTSEWPPVPAHALPIPQQQESDNG